jgi:hypothetical protein
MFDPQAAENLIREAKCHIGGAIDLLPREEPRRTLIEVMITLDNVVKTLQAAEEPEDETDFCHLTYDDMGYLTCSYNHTAGAKCLMVIPEEDPDTRCPKCDRYPSEKPFPFLPKCNCVTNASRRIIS